MKNLLLLGGFAACLLASACTEDRFSQVVDIEIPEHESRPTLSLDIVNGDTVIWPTISYSVGILEDDPTERPATLQLFRDGTLIYNLETTTESFQRSGFPLPQPIPETPAEYEAVVAVDGIGTARATQQLPTVPTAEVLSYDPDGGIDIDGFRVGEAIVRLTDPPGERNYYAFRILSPDQQCNQDICTFTYRESYSRFISSPDPIVRQAGYHGAVVLDESFDGTSYDVRIQFDVYGDAQLALEVWSMTEDGYRFAASLEAYQLARDNPFAEPVTVHNNLDEGYGIFMASARRRFILEE